MYLLIQLCQSNFIISQTELSPLDHIDKVKQYICFAIKYCVFDPIDSLLHPLGTVIWTQKTEALNTISNIMMMIHSTCF
jgi:hypothetical protein